MKPAARGGEVAVRDVDGDALLAFGAQAVGEQREVGGVLAAAREARSTASSWSVRTDLESCSSRPTRVDLPSSTDPAVAKRSRVVADNCSTDRGSTAGRLPDRNPNDPTSWGKVGRNEACPCGSGKKYKHCHGRFG